MKSVHAIRRQLAGFEPNRFPDRHSRRRSAVTLLLRENDLTEPRANKLQMLAGVLNVSIMWLLTGEGQGLDDPAEGEELFFVATGLGDGSHKFSVTKDEHDAAVAEYLVRLRQQLRQGR